MIFLVMIDNAYNSELKHSINKLLKCLLEFEPSESSRVLPGFDYRYTYTYNFN